MSESFIKIVRKLIEWEWYNDSKMVHLFIHLLLKANFKNNSWRGIDVKRGQLVTGLNKLHEQTHISKQSIRTCLKKLQLTHEITLAPTNQYSLITLVNYEKYQTFRDELNTQTNKPSTRGQHAGNKQSTTREERKKIKKETMKSYSAPQKEDAAPETVLGEVKAEPEKKENVPPKEKKERTDLHHRIIEIYSRFMINLNNIKPEITGQDGEGAKRIITYLKKVVKGEKSDDEICLAFEYILDKWDKLEPFIQKQIKLTQIHSNLNTIITQIKNPKLNQNVNGKATQGHSGEVIVTAVQRRISSGVQQNEPDGS